MLTDNNQVQVNARINVVDVLRGMAIMGIIILHSVEHFNFYRFPAETAHEWMQFTDKAIWDGLFFTFGGKAYAIFALLFGFSFYIQDDNQQRRGKDFRLRFLWRLMLLFLLGQLNAAFFTAEILTMYALLGFVLALCCRLSNKMLLIIAVILVLQPVDWGKLVYALLNPDYVAGAGLAGGLWRATFQAQSEAGFWEMVKVNLWEGQLASLAWAWEHGRILQTAALFLFGLWVGRTGLFRYSPENERRWMRYSGFALLCFFPLYGLNQMFPDFIVRKEVLVPLQLVISSLSNLSFAVLLVCGVLFLFYYSRKQTFWMYFAPYGRMSLTNYIGQSLIGSLCFYHWGFYWELGKTYSFLFGIALFLFQFIFCNLWLRRFSHGPFEWIWKKLTWIGEKH